ncbi:PEP-utilizing enzyme [Nanchangia anserum]|uniref:PEP-utilizing enzyme n=1 Tax=Nanchangia anserum TaxID=2692125 RepID=UPI001D1054A1|nr:PEP-utilizing enzyme [Nanchangia anserum]
MAGSPGLVTASARIIISPDDFNRLQPGDILVCQYTDPTWTPLFGLAAGVVADTGGQLSHAAIVAREYGIPAVMGTRTATSRIADGQTITVDGTKGTVLLG